MSRIGEVIGGYRPSTAEVHVGSGKSWVPRKTFEQSIDVKALGLLDIQPTSGVQIPPEVAFTTVVKRLDSHGVQVRPMRDADINSGQYKMALDISESSLQSIRAEDQPAKVQRQFVTTVVESFGLGDKLYRVPGWTEERTLFVPDESVPPPTAIGDEFTTDVMGNYSSQIRIADKVLDLGTGSGIIAVSSGLMGANEVTATDINYAALTAVKVSWAVNGLPMDRLDARYSDGFSGLNADSRFDMIFTNPPVQPETGFYGESYLAFNEAGPDGRKVLDEILVVGPKFLTPEGRIVTTSSSRHGDHQTQNILRERKADADISDWHLVLDREIPLEERYRSYIPDWLKRGGDDGDVRIIPTSQPKNGPTGYSHLYKVYELKK